ncbi:BT_3928 family protein [Robertkochia solimangrovi]|uniref:BT_3928 family protein n=1 Tax=Robertkochia solimangrovi TaxID=2213046 RepID=UPI00117E217A|nr:BT_3928 family protein [Robertkochia solimangrovi]TRZ41689.1 DoxX family protein [Robertkochia solimangrovi]
MRLLVNLSRTIVGILFIISGLIKMNDPVGFSFKLEEYFGADVLNIEFLIPFALAIAVILVILECLLGVMLLLGYKVKFTVWSLFAMILFFTFLTFYSAYFNKVTDCGCFGDAVKLTPWESFTKDVILLLLIVVLLFGQRYIKPLLQWSSGRTVTVIFFILFLAFSHYVYHHLPVIDFRPYKVGANISEGMTIPDGAPEATFEYSWKFNVGGEEKVIVTNGEYPDVDGELIGVETEQITEGYEPPIHDFTMEKDGVDHKEEILGLPKVMVVVSRVLNEADEEALQELPETVKKAKEAGYKVIGMTASSVQEMGDYKTNYGLDFDFYFCDLTTLKTIVRSNPGVFLMERGIITDKEHFNDLDDLNLE